MRHLLYLLDLGWGVAVSCCDCHFVGGLTLRDIASSRGWKRLRHGEPRSHCSLHTIWSTSGHLILDLTLREPATNRPRADLISHLTLRRFAIPPIVAQSER
jgi:hypothetical protein